MAPNAVALALAKETGRGYHEVRIGINRLVNNGWTPMDAVALVERAATTEGSITDAVDAELERASARA